MELNNVKAIVTGACGGIGQAVTCGILEGGGTVGAICRSCPEPQDQLLPLKCDVTKPDEVSEAFATFCDKHGPPNVLVNNAGVLLDGPIISIGATGINKYPLDKWSQTLSTNLTGVFLCAQEFVSSQVKNNIKNSVIINISSVARNGNAGQCAYSSSKGAVASLTKTLAKELLPLKIRTVAIAPGLIDTPMAQLIPESYKKIMIKNSCAKRIGQPHEVFHAVQFCIENEFFSGKILELDGGVFIG